ncbi:L-rhamnose mutarotase [Companilactobacillus kedongensis]|uniref:L-rhamnose mutarotase n=1 Tax=Companilactobacillus kedongensis TaxID=2486004 RepID=UPI000F795146|nr:L-rhamnose mutarotase [Companilactobacillus kedongensis]
MKRIAQIMYLNKDKYQEYQQRHENLWPEMEQALKAHGATNYSIFLNKENGELFAYLEVQDEKRYNEIANTEICKKWWHYMAPIMETNKDESPKTLDLSELFHLD